MEKLTNSQKIKISNIQSIIRQTAGDALITYIEITKAKFGNGVYVNVTFKSCGHEYIKYFSIGKRGRLI